MSYKDTIIDGIKEALKTRFQIGSNAVNTKVVNATKILHFQRWPLPDCPDVQG